MSQHTKRFAGLSSLALVGCMTACGDAKDINMANVDTKAMNEKVKSSSSGTAKSESEVTLGLVSSSASDLEHWEIAKKDGSPFLYKPDNYDVAMSAFRRSTFSESGQTCSGIMIHEQDPKNNQKYNIYYMTAQHCLYKVSPLGERINSSMGSVKLEAFENKFNEYFPPFQNQKFIYGFYNSQEWMYLNYRLYKRSLSSNLVDETISDAPEIYASSDVIRIPYKKNVSADDARKTSLPLCSAVEPAGDKVFANQATPVRLMLGNSRQKKTAYSDWLMLERMNGRHNISGTIRGEYRKAESLAALNDFVFKSVVFGESVSFYGYNSLLGGGAEPTDSGAPILYGTQEPLSQNLKILFKKSVEADFAENWKISSINCVSGVVSRQLSRKFGYRNNANDTSFQFHFKYFYPEIKSEINTIGSETITIIQEVTNKNLWKKI